jgi:hypothetical protein
MHHLALQPCGADLDPPPLEPRDVTVARAHGRVAVIRAAVVLRLRVSTHLYP